MATTLNIDFRMTRSFTRRIRLIERAPAYAMRIARNPAVMQRMVKRGVFLKAKPIVSPAKRRSV